MLWILTIQKAHVVPILAFPQDFMPTYSASNLVSSLCKKSMAIP